MKVEKLDRRHIGHFWFTHRVVIEGRRPAQRHKWIQIRNWLWSQYGPSAERDLAIPQYFNGQQPLWAWDSKLNSIYLRDEAVTMFQLVRDRWENLETL